MIPRKPLAIWQNFAQSLAAPGIGFATGSRLRNDGFGRGTQHLSAGPGLDCYPFPSPWPGCATVGPVFCRSTNARQAANCMKDALLGFDLAMIPVESPAIKTNQRGRSACVKPLSFFLCSPFPWLAAWTTRPRAGLAAQRQARSWRVQPTTMRLPAQSSAALRVLRRVRCQRHSAPATDLTAALAATSIATASRGARPRLAVFHLQRPAHSQPGLGPFHGEYHV